MFEFRSSIPAAVLDLHCFKADSSSGFVGDKARSPFKSSSRLIFGSGKSSYAVGNTVEFAFAFVSK